MLISSFEDPQIPRKDAHEYWKALKRVILRHPETFGKVFQLSPLLKALSVPSNERTKEDIDLIYLWLLKVSNIDTILGAFSLSVIHQLCRSMSLQEYHPYDIVCSQGESANACYFLLAGSATLYLRNSTQDHSITTLHRLKSIMPLKEVQYGTPCVTLVPGDSYGEACLLDSSMKRQHSLIIDENAGRAYMIVLTEEDYTRITREQKYDDHSIASYITLLQRLYLFKYWTRNQILRIAAESKVVTFQENQYICRKGDEVEYFFVVLNGKIKESVSITTPANSDAPARIVTIETALLGPNDIGGENVLKKHAIFPVDMKAVSSVHLLTFSKKIIQSHIESYEKTRRFAKHTLRWLQSSEEAKIQWRELRLEQAKKYSGMEMHITQKIMRISRTFCTICGRNTHVAGDLWCTLRKLPNHPTEETTTIIKKQPDRRVSTTPVGIERRSIQSKISNSPPSILPCAPSITRQRPQTCRYGTYGKSLLEKSWKAANDCRPKTSDGNSIRRRSLHELSRGI